TSDLTAHDSQKTRKVPIHIAPEHLAELRSLSESLHYARGKSDILQHELKKNYPDAHLTDNELRCHIKRRRTSRRVQVDLHASAPILPPRLLSEMGRATSCSSCRKKHMKCGDHTQNRDCLLFATNRGNRTITEYFNSQQ
ncbi:hypothetical protein PHMEG_00023521, partial [Phytophthora megakarya]